MPIVNRYRLHLLPHSSMASHDEPRNYPFLSKEEFSLACHLLDQKYIAAYLGQERRAFRLRLQYSMISDTIYLSITKPIDVSKNDLNITLDLQALGWEEKDDSEDILMDMDAEDADSVSPS
jgi:ubiquitin-like-conjugating enzyme ATG10